MQTPQRRPLFWPSGWPRSTSRQAASFGKMVKGNGEAYAGRKSLTPGEAMKRLEAELDALGAGDPLLSTNLELNLSGQPRGDKADPTDPGAAVFFVWKGQKYELACDKWNRVADNIAALAKYVEALRGMDRWGVGSVKQLLTGFIALPAPEQWWHVFDCSRNADRATIEAAFKKAAMAGHPDRGGSDAQMARVNGAMAMAEDDLKSRGL